MPLQIRRGTTAQRLSIVPLQGEPIFDTDQNLLYIGNGVTAGGQALTGITLEDARDATGAMLANGQHDGITFIFGAEQDLNDRIDARIDLSNYDGEIVATALRGPLFADDSSLIVDSNTKNITANDIVATSLSVSSLILTGAIVADFKGSVFGDDSTVLINAVENSINLDGTVKGNIIPDANEVYDIGSASNRFKDLYLSGTSLFLGSAQITAVGSAIELPAGSTVAGVPIGTGSGSGDGVIEGSNYKINIVADNSSVLVNSDTGELSGNLTGNVLGNLTGDVLGNLTGNVLGNLTGNVLGDVIGNITGYHTGDMTGSVFADDSTVMVNALDKTFQGSFIGNVDGNVTGDVIADSVSTQFLDGDASSVITVRTSMRVQSDLNVENELIAEGDLNVFGNLNIDNILNGSTGTLRIGTQTELLNRLEIVNEQNDNISVLNISKSNDGNFASRLVLERSRGNAANPVAVQNTDLLSTMSFVGYDGSNYVTAASITSTVDNTVTSGKVPGNISFATRNVAGNLLERGRFTSAGNFELYLPLFMARTNVLNDFMILQQFTSSPNDSSNLTFTRARGTQAVPTAANANDAIIDLAAAAFDGVTYTGSSTIRMNIDGSVSSGIVPGRIEFWTADATGSQTKKAQFNRDGILEVDRIQALNSNLSIVGDIIGSVFSDASTMVIDGTDGSIKYYPSTPADWAGTAPTTIGEAIDRLAARLKLIDGGVGA